MKKRLLSLLLAVVLCIGLLPVGAGAAEASISTDAFDADGDLTESTGYTANGSTYDGSSGDDTLSGNFYIVQGNVTVEGNLTIESNTNGGLVLCEGATLTVEGALICNGGRDSFQIYGQTYNNTTRGKTGRLIIQNFKNDGAAIRFAGTAESGLVPTLTINSGELELHSSSGKLIEGVKLKSAKPIHAGTLDGDPVALSVWSKDPSEGTVAGSTLVIEYCGHENSYDVEFIPDEGSTATHHMRCKVCGFTWASDACFTESTLDDIQSNGAEGHTRAHAGRQGACQQKLRMRLYI